MFKLLIRLLIGPSINRLYKQRTQLAILLTCIDITRGKNEVEKLTLQKEVIVFRVEKLKFKVKIKKFVHKDSSNC
jgi:hypothetical protein